MVLLVNQHTVPIYLDVVNAFAHRGEDPILFTGHIEQGGSDPLPDVRIKKSIRYRRNSGLSRALTWLMFTAHYALYLATCAKPRCILVATNPPLAPIVTAFFARLRKIPFYIVLYDLYPEALSQARVVEDGNIVFKIWQRINRRVFGQSKKIFTLSESMKTAASAYTNTSDKIHIVYNWVDTSYIRPIAKSENPFVSRHGLENKFVVLYSGNMGLTHDLESLVEAAVILKGVPNLCFVLIGDGGKRKALENIVRTKSPGNVLFLPFQDAHDFPFAMASADVGVVTLGTGGEGISVPSKTYVNLAAGLCILSIAPASSELNRLISEHEAGFICEPGHPEEVARVIRLLLSDEKRLRFHQRKALDAALLYTPANAYQYVDETVGSPVVNA